MAAPDPQDDCTGSAPGPSGSGTGGGGRSGDAEKTKPETLAGSRDPGWAPGSPKLRGGNWARAPARSPPVAMETASTGKAGGAAARKWRLGLWSLAGPLLFNSPMHLLCVLYLQDQP